MAQNSANNPFYGLNMETLVGLANLLQIPTNEEKRPDVRFAEIMNIPEYIAKSYRGNILPFNKDTSRLLSIEHRRILKWSSVTDVKAVDDLVQILEHQIAGNAAPNNPAVAPVVPPVQNVPLAIEAGLNTEGDAEVRRNVEAIPANPPEVSNAAEANAAEAELKEELYPVGTVVQLVTRLLAYSLHYRRCLSSVPDKRLTAALHSLSDYRSVMLDLGNPFTTLQWNDLIGFLSQAQTLLRLPLNPFGDPTAEAQIMVSGMSPFAITGGAIHPLDTTVSFLENLYRQAAGEYRTFEKNTHIASYMIKFPFKEYVTHKIPMKRVINGAYTCYVDPLSKTYYYTTLILDPFRFKVLKNLLIYEIVTGKSAYIHSALYFFMSMCTCEEDFQLMNEYGVIEWDYPMEGYDGFCEKMKELMDVMYCWKISSTYTMHLEMIKIAKWKAKVGDQTTPFGDFAVSCYASGLLKKDVSATLYSNLG
jgi:hypothetical protein